MRHLPQALSPTSSSLPPPPEGQWLPPATVTVRRGREQLRTSCNENMTPAGGPTRPPAILHAGPGQMRPGPGPSCPSFCLPRAKNLGSLHLLALVSRMPFLKGRIFTIAMRSSMITRMPPLLCECPLTRER